MSGKRPVLATALAVAILALAALTLVARLRPISTLFGVVVAAASPYAPVMALVGLILSAIARRTSLTIISVLVLTITTAIQIPRYTFTRPATTQFADVRVLSSNLRKGQADPAAFIKLAKESADVIAVSELTPEAVEGFSQAGIDAAFPYSVLFPGAGAGGIGLWSRYPLDAVSPGARRSFTMVAARVQVPGVQVPPLIASVHVFSPVASQRDTVDGWEVSIADAKAVLDRFSDVAGEAAAIVAGDFNTTSDMQQFRALLSNGYRDATDQTGAGFVPTFPADSWLPPALEIDHVLTRRATATSLTAVTVDGSDHRALLATVHIPTIPQPLNDG
ncbi:endonuclease/exonuclease/phosphatase family protein [Mycolicibacterium sp. ELW1]|uniref:endonuclease/exonuclease/phosphatase family protein n=1 Tax=Mycobacteriaceae TaxID=1762 RepID=UPI0011EED341|nr:endonuclease/exonuclease/phosphatase family protein [Mycobacterium sp. ELW1]QEN12674.1 endonuclease/exonuclease/phosphatase family protein [Mycobacterium sp. ELW1]